VAQPSLGHVCKTPIKPSKALSALDLAEGLNPRERRVQPRIFKMMWPANLKYN